jgi:CheY-like chemotaxis protein
VQTAGDGREGFHKAAQTYFDIIVSDIDMPHMSGLEFYEKLTTEHPDQKNSFIFITGDLNEERKKFGVLKGVRMFQKPFNLNTFKSFILETVEI